jgi:hypothetical protein
LGTVGFRNGTGHAEEGSRFVERVAKAVEVSVERDQVEEIAVLAGGGVGLMFNCT